MVDEAAQRVAYTTATEADRRAPGEFRALAIGGVGIDAVRLIGAVHLIVVGSEDMIDPAGRAAQRGAEDGLLAPGLAVDIVQEAVKIGIGIKLRIRLPVGGEEGERPVLAELNSRVRQERETVRAVFLAVRVGAVDTRRGEAGNGAAKDEAIGAGGEAGRSAGGFARPRLEVRPEAGALSRLDRDHAANRVGAIEGGLLTAQDLDARDVEAGQEAEIGLARDRIGKLDSVEEDQGVVGFGAAHPDLGQPAKRA